MAGGPPFGDANRGPADHTDPSSPPYAPPSDAGPRPGDTQPFGAPPSDPGPRPGDTRPFGAPDAWDAGAWGAGAWDAATPPPPGPPPYGSPYGPGYAPYGPYASTGWVPVPKNNGLAIASMVCGICAFAVCQLVAIPGLILGIRARRQIRESGGAETGDAFALTGIVLSGIAIALLVLIIAVYVVVIGAAVSTS